jgi:hypothetical protein
MRLFKALCFWLTMAMIVLLLHSPSLGQMPGGVSKGPQVYTIQGDCRYTVAPKGKTFPHTGGAFTLKVAATGQSYCSIPIVSQKNDWISITAAEDWNGKKGTLGVTVAPTTRTEGRAGEILIAGAPVTVNQKGASCSGLTIQPSSQVWSRDGGNGSFAVAVSADDCPWKTGKHDRWILVTSDTGTGSGGVLYTVDVNTTGRERVGTISVSLSKDPAKRKVFTIRQGR